MSSSHNPFRTPKASPNTTGVPSTSTLPNGVIHDEASPRLHIVVRTPSPSSPPEDLPHGPEHLPPRSSSDSERRVSPPAEDLISEDLPPAYTPAPDVAEGETTIELGPRRPFQEPPRPPQHPYYRSPIPNAPQLTGSGWASYPGLIRAQPTGMPYLRQNPPLPPRHSSRSGRDGRPSSAPNDENLSDFARDFYAAGAADTRALAAEPEIPPRPSSSSGRYAPPSGNPPQDDGRPTEFPTPGHPLLRKGNVLVYPAGYECSKCRNTGYKNNDPLLPCSKCWDRYSRRFAGPLVYTSWGRDMTSSTGGARTTLQRPLPKFTPPQLSVDTRSGHRATQSLGASSSRVLPVAGGGVPMSPYLDPLQRMSPSGSNVRLVSNPPRGAAVVQPGDPRIGGRLCWRCGGSGTTTFLIFDEMPCSVCNGIGRTFG
ncbi:hypothetical protein BKA93DRAFT_759863 [Sparassis latifolia]